MTYPTPEDLTQSRRQAPAVPDALSEAVPDGIETTILHRLGFTRWQDLYPARQLEVLLRSATLANHRRYPTPIRRRLLTAICGAAEMAGYVSRWDRYYPKAFEAIANHRYGVVGLAVETNLLGPRGRGTLARRLSASVKAARWTQDHVPERARSADVASSQARRRGHRRTVLAYGSSERQLPPDGSVTLALTDPPYFDDVQYGELAGLFLAWARAIDLIPARVALDLHREAVPNNVRGTTERDYQRLLKRIFRETKRTLAPNGRLILTYHNTDLEGWFALARALDSAGFQPVALAVVHAENETDHPKRMTGAFRKDLVIECLRASEERADPDVVWCTEDSEDRELIAAGRALAVGDTTFRRFVATYWSLAAPIPEADRKIRAGREITAKGGDGG